MVSRARDADDTSRCADLLGGGVERRGKVEVSFCHSSG